MRQGIIGLFVLGTAVGAIPSPTPSTFRGGGWNQVRGDSASTGFARQSVIESDAQVVWTTQTRYGDASPQLGTPVAFRNHLYMPQGLAGLGRWDCLTGTFLGAFTGSDPDAWFVDGVACEFKNDRTLVYVGARNILYGLDDSGPALTKIWETRLPSGMSVISDLSLAKGRLIFMVFDLTDHRSKVVGMGTDGALQAIYSSDRDWLISERKPLVNPFTGNTYIETGSGIRCIHADGHEGFLIADPTLNTPVLDPVQNRLYIQRPQDPQISSLVSSIRCFDATDGRLLWDSQDHGVLFERHASCTPVLARDMLFLSSGNSPDWWNMHVLALDAGTGTLVWQTPFANAIPLDAILMTADMKLWGKSRFGDYRCLDGLTGQPLAEGNFWAGTALGDFCADKDSLYFAWSSGFSSWIARMSAP